MLQTTITFSKMVTRNKCRLAPMDSELMLVLQLKRKKVMMAGVDTTQQPLRINKNPLLTRDRNANGKQTMWTMILTILVDPHLKATTTLLRRPSQIGSELDSNNKIHLDSALRNQIPSHRPSSKQTLRTSRACTLSSILNNRSQLKQ